MPNLTPGKNIGFKVGLQSTVNDIISGAAGAPIVVPGSFYLAEDTHRLYVGNDDLTLSPVNEGITFITNQSDLPTLTTSNITQYAGQLYYITSSNILCMAANTNDPTGNVPHWVQINPDTYLMSTSSAVTTELANNVVTVTTRVQDTIGQLDNNNRLQPVHTASGQFKIQGGDNVTLTKDQTTGAIKISTPSGDIYHLNAAALGAGSDPAIVDNREQYVKLVLSSDSHEDEIVYLTKGDQGNITPTMSSVTIGEGNEAVTYPIIKFNGGGIVGTTIQLGMDTNDKLTFTLVNGNDRVSTNITPTLSYGKAVDTGSNKVNKVDFNLTGNANTGYTLTGDLNVYTINEVDALINQQLQGFDAMYFAGTIGSAADTFDNLEDLYNTATADAKIKSGATFKFTQAIGEAPPTGMTIAGWKTTPDTHEQSGAQVGDMLIITGDETATGYIDPKASTTKYTYIPAGDDTDIYYTPNFGTAKTLSFAHSSNNALVHQVNFTEGADVVVTGTISNNYRTQTINIAHSTITTTPTTASALTNTGQSQDYTAVTGLTISNGHITGYETQKITLSHYRLSKAETKAVGGTETYVGSGKYSDVSFGTDYWTGASDGANTIQLNAGTNGYNNKMNLSSSTLQFSINSAGAASGTATAASVAIDMVWGSF